MRGWEAWPGGCSGGKGEAGTLSVWRGNWQEWGLGPGGMGGEPAGAGKRQAASALRREEACLRRHRPICSMDLKCKQSINQSTNHRWVDRGARGMRGGSRQAQHSTGLGT